MPKEVEQIYQAGCNDFVSKPYEFPLLLGKIQQLLAARSQP